MSYYKWTKADGSIQYVEGHGAKTYYSELEDLTGTGNVWVSDSINGMFDTASESELTKIEIRTGTDENGFAAFVDEYNQHIDNEFKKATENAPSTFGVGSLFSTVVGDGRAFYVVTKVNKKTCEIEWRNYGADNYVDQILGYGGKFDIERIQPLVNFQNNLDKMFG
jgi:hypothetical protein